MRKLLTKENLIVAVMVFCGFLLSFWTFVVPEETIVKLIEDSIIVSGAETRIAGFKKGLFYTFSIDAVSINKEKELFSVQEIKGRISPLALLGLKLKLSFAGKMAGGEISGYVELLRGKNMIDITIRDSDLSGLKFLESIGISGTGAIKGDFSMRADKGEMTFSIDSAKFQTTVFSGVPIPLDLFTSANGALTISSGVIDLKSFALEGKGIFARLKGTLKGSLMEMTLEVMPSADSPSSGLIAVALEKYKISEGHYSIPIKKNLDE